MQFTLGETEEDNESESQDFLPKPIAQALQDPEIQVQVLEEAQRRNIPPQILKAFMPGSDLEASEAVKAIQETTQAQEQSAGGNSNRQADSGEDPGIPASERGIDSTTESDNPTDQGDIEMPEPTNSDSIDHNDLVDFIEEIIGYQSEDTTLGELKDWVEDNPQIADNACKMYL